MCYGKRFYNDFFLNHNTKVLVRNCLTLSGLEGGGGWGEHNGTPEGFAKYLKNGLANLYETL